MEESLMRVWTNLMDRVGGPMTFRVILQPTMAVLLAVRAGLKDAREGRPPYLWTILTDPEERDGLLREGWKATARVFLLAVIMDVIYQLIVQHLRIKARGWNAGRIFDCHKVGNAIGSIRNSRHEYVAVAPQSDSASEIVVASHISVGPQWLASVRVRHCRIMAINVSRGPCHKHVPAGPHHEANRLADEPEYGRGGKVRWRVHKDPAAMAKAAGV